MQRWITQRHIPAINIGVIVILGNLAVVEVDQGAASLGDEQVTLVILAACPEVGKNAVYSVSVREQYSVGDLSDSSVFVFLDQFPDMNFTQRYRFVDSGEASSASCRRYTSR